MFTWASLAAAFLRLAKAVAGYFSDKQLIDAGQAKADARHAKDALAARERMDDAKANGPQSGDAAADRLRDGTF